MIDRLRLRIPLFQAPMAGVATPELAAAVSDAGALGGLGLATLSAADAAAAMMRTKALTERPFNVNLFCHAAPRRDGAQEQAWIDRAAPLFAQYDATPPGHLDDIYIGLTRNDDLFNAVLTARPAVVSLHFGLPRDDQMQALRQAGCLLIGSATSTAEARALERAGLDAIVAQGWQAGGHRGVFDPDAPDQRLDTETLTRQLVRATRLPVIAAGGLMDGADIACALSWGAVAAQLGTAFIGCPQSAADAGYRARLAQGGATVMTRAISGRPARGLANRITDWGQVPDATVPDYPLPYDLAKALNAAAKARGEAGFGAQWAGMGADRARTLPAADLVMALKHELCAADPDYAARAAC